MDAKVSVNKFLKFCVALFVFPRYMKMQLLFVCLVIVGSSAVAPKFLRNGRPTDLSGHKRTRDEMENRFHLVGSESSLEERGMYIPQWSSEEITEFVRETDSSSTDKADGEDESQEDPWTSWGFHDELDDTEIGVERLSNDANDTMDMEQYADDHIRIRRRCEGFDSVEEKL